MLIQHPVPGDLLKVSLRTFSHNIILFVGVYVGKDDNKYYFIRHKYSWSGFITSVLIRPNSSMSELDSSKYEFFLIERPKDVGEKNSKE